MTTPSKARLLRTAVGAVLDAGGIVLRRPRPVTVESKSVPRDLVSEVDRQAENRVRKRLKQAFPSIPVVGEEGEKERHQGKPYWVVDPLDGTVNHVHGVPHFSVSIAYADGDEVVVGTIYDPVRRELFTAVKGGGAFLNRRRIRVSKTERLETALLATGFPYSRAGPDNNVDHFTHMLQLCHGVRRLGSACLDLAYVAAGRFDGYWELSLNAWDMAAGTLLVTEAGGLVTEMAGAPLRLSSGSVLATNGLLHADMERELRSR